MAVRVAVNGFGRIGRLILRAIIESKRNDLVVVGVNDLGPVETNAHLLRYDSVHGRFPGEVKVDGEHMIVDGRNNKVTPGRKTAPPPSRTRPRCTVRRGGSMLQCTASVTARRSRAVAFCAGSLKFCAHPRSC